MEISSYIQFKENIPLKITTLFQDTVLEKLPVVEVIERLRDAIFYRKDIIINDFSSIYKKFTNINAPIIEKKEIVTLVSKILLGSGPTTNIHQIDILLDFDIKSSQCINNSLFFNLISSLQILTETPANLRNSNLIIRYLMLQTFVPHTEREILYKGISKIPPERREYVLSATAAWFVKFQISTELKVQFLIWVDSFLKNQAAIVINKAMPIFEDIIAESPNIKEKEVNLDLEDFCCHKTLMENIYNLPQESRDDYVDVQRKALRIFKGLQASAKDMQIIKDLLTNIPFDDRSKILNIALPFLFKFEKTSDKIVLLKLFSELCISELDTFNHKYSFFITGATSLQQFERVFHVIYSIQPEEWDEIFNCAQFFFQDGPNSINNILFLKIISKLKSGERGEVIQTAFPLIKKWGTPAEVKKILKAIQSIPKEQRSEVLFIGDPYIHEAENGLDLADIINNLSSIQTSWNKLLIDASELTENVSTPVDKSFILGLVDRIPIVKRKEIFERADHWFKKQGKVSNTPLSKAKLQKRALKKAIILGLLLNIEPARWELINKRLEILCTSDTKFQKKILLLDTLNDISDEDWNYSYNCSKPFLTYNNCVNDNIAMITTINNIPKSDRENILKICEPLISGVEKRTTIALIIYALNKIPSKERGDVVEKAKEYISKYETILQFEEFLKLISSTPRFERNPEIIKLLFHLSKLNRSSDQPLSYFLDFIAPNKRILVIQKYKEIIDVNKDVYLTEGLLRFLFTFNNEVRVESHNFISKCMDTYLVNACEAYQYAKLILDNHDELKLYEDHPLIQQVLHVYFYATPEALLNKKNPYSVYKNLQEIYNQPPISFNPSFYSHDFNLQYFSETGQKLAPEKIEIILSLNLDFMRKEALYDVKYTLKDLPASINAETLKNLFVLFNSRINSLPSGKRDNLLSFIEAKFNISLELLQNDLLAKPFIKDLLQVNASCNEFISKDAYYFYTILQAIEETDEGLLDNGLTCREDFLLMFAHTMQECSGGQRDGLKIIFNLLDVKYRKKESHVERTSEETLKSISQQTVQKVLGDIFLGDALVRAFTKENQTEQPAHQSIYLINLLSKEVGFDQELQFDLYTSTISDKLFNAKLEEVVAAFFNECPPKRIIEQLRKDLAQMIQNENKKIDMNLKFLLENLNSNHPKVSAAIPPILKDFKESNVRLTHLILKNSLLSNLPQFLSFPNSPTQLALQSFFDECVHPKKPGWLNLYLEIQEDAEFFPTVGVTELGAIEILIRTHYLTKKHIAFPSLQILAQEDEDFTNSSPSKKKKRAPEDEPSQVNKIQKH